MDISKAMQILKLNDFSYLNEENVKKNYRDLIRKNHPDLGGNNDIAKEINEAHETLLNALNIIKTNNKVTKQSTYIISFEDLIKIFKGNTVKYGEKDINIKNINRLNIVIDININVSFNEFNWEYNKFEIRKLDDKYSIQCKYKVANINDKVIVNIKAYGKELTLDVSVMNQNINLDYNGIKLKIMLERQLMDDESKNRVKTANF